MEVGLFPATKTECLSACISIFQRMGVTAVKF